MSVPVPSRDAFRGLMAKKFQRGLKRAMFMSTLVTVAFYFSHTVPTIRRTPVCWDAINNDKLFRNMQAAGAYTYIDKDGKFSNPDDDE